MRDNQGNLGADYSRALRGYLAGAAEEELARAYQLGRRAMAEGLGVLDMVEVHHRALSRLLDEPPITGSGREALEAATAFFREVLSPFEITHRGFREATEVMQNVVLFASVLCHELITPLTSILASAGMLEEILDLDPSSSESRLLANIRAGAATLKARTDDLADIVAFQSGAFRLHVVPIRVSTFLVDACRRLELEVTQAGMELNVGVPDDLPVIKGDPDRLEQVVANLVRNAVKYGSDGGRAEVRAASAHGAVEITVQDFGRGISRRDRLRLFEPYFRAEEGRDELPGLGVGLVLCRQIVEAHRGTIAVESGEGKGTLIRVVLPAVRARGAAGTVSSQ